MSKIMTVYQVVWIYTKGWSSEGTDIDDINALATNKLYSNKHDGLIQSINSNIKKLNNGNPCTILDPLSKYDIIELEKKNNDLISQLNIPSTKYMSSYTIVVENRVM